MMNRLIYSTILSALLLVGCSDIDKGTVTSKSHHDAWTQVTMVYVNKTAIPQVIYHSEQWTINITDSGKTGYCNVTKERFDSINVGDWIECDQH